MRGKLIIFAILVSLFIIPYVSAVCEPNVYAKQNQIYDLKISCDLEGANCPATVLCNFTSTYPNNTIHKNNLPMTNLLNGYYNITLNENDTLLNGNYEFRVSCISSTYNDTSVGCLGVNPTGMPPSDQRTAVVGRSIYITFALAILFALGAYMNKGLPYRLTFGALALIFILITINLVFTTLQDEVVNENLINFFDTFTAASYYLFWLAGGLIFLIWFITIFQTLLLKSNKAKMEKYGI